ncbi:MAG: hypothetical protein HUU35_03230, partial [Armatimonadetes bacterium]|nr:hypothetical protein [Armatimonadota bacterium]
MRTLALLLCLAAAAAAQDNLLADPSFEAAASSWVLTCHAGAEGTLTLAPEARTGKQALRVTKTNGLGYLILAPPARLPITAGTVYDSALHLRVERAEFASAHYFVNIDRDAAGKDLPPYHYSPHHAFWPRFLPGGQWLRHAARWTAPATAADTELRFVIAGNPITLLIDDAELLPSPPAGNYPGKVNNSEPPYDEARARANLARRQPEPARVEMVAGKPAFLVGDDYRSGLIHQGSFWAPNRSRYHNFGQAGIHLQTIAVQFGPLTDFPLTVWKYPNGLDFSGLERDLLQAVGADPEVRVIILVRTDAPRPWTLEHPDQVWAAEDGRRWVCADGMHPSHLGELTKPQEVHLASYGSPAYLDLMSGALTELGTWLKTHEVGKIVAGFMVGGNTDGQFLSGSVGGQLDHSPGNQQGFRLWLRERYGSAAALQAAWGDPAVTLETATLAPEALRGSEAPFLVGQGPAQRVADSNRFDSVAPARAIKRFARALKESIGRPTFAITYWADAFHDQGANRYALAELLSGPDRVDCTATVQEYAPWRTLGHPGSPNGVWGSQRLRGVAPLCELDYRTYLSSMAGPWGVEDLGAPLTAEGFRAQIRRDLGAAATRGATAWFYDMGGIWFDDPPLWETIREGQQIMAWTHRPEAPRPAARLAVFLDEEAGWRAGLNHFGLLNMSTNAQRRALNLSGVPYDAYLLEDIAHPNLPDYDIYLFLSAWCPSEAQQLAIRERCLRAGRIAVFPGAPGLGTAAGAVATMKALTGFDFAVRPKGAP